MAAPMRLTLRIENVDRLDTGGPLLIDLEGRGCQAGRNPSMDWVLPDATRTLSSHHFDVLFRDDAYWLTDVSSNGTYLHGQRHRLQGPARISDGDRFLAGPYIIVAELRPGAAPGPTVPPFVVAPAYEPPQSPRPRPDPALPAQAAFAPAPEQDIWDFAGEPPDWPPEPAPAALLHDPAGPASPDMSPAAVDGWDGPTNPSPRPWSPAGAEAAAAWSASRTPVVSPAVSPVTIPVAPPQPAPVPRAPVAAPRNPDPDVRALLAAFCDGAGLDPANYPGLDPEAVMRQAGRAIKTTSREVIRMLRDRSKVKESVAAGERTMLEPRENNPLKFAKDPSQAVEALFLKPRDGYLAGSEAIESALDDLRRHQMAIFGAMQAALADLLDGLSPEDIEAAAGGGLFGGASKTRWDTYVRRWEEKATQGENGMLDAFIRAFAKAYAEAANR